jgi:hypothetical protein
MDHDTPEDEVVTGELVTIDPPQTPANLFLTNDPRMFLTRAGQVADALATMIRQQKLSIRIRGRDYVLVEGWTALGSLLGVFPVTEWTRPVEDGWEARVSARTRAGEIVGAAESMCTRKETKWEDRDEYAIRSMAATRATAKALRQPLGFVMALAGFDPTPLDEIDNTDTPEAEREPEPAPPRAAAHTLPPQVQPTVDQLDRIKALIAQLSARDPDTDWRAKAAEIAGVPARLMTKTVADILIRQLENEIVAA